MLVYRTAKGSAFSLYQTEYAGQAGHTIAQWHVADVAAAVRDPWFKDSENNILCIDDGFPGDRVG